MATANSNTEPQADPFDLALAAIDEFDRSQLPPVPGSGLRITSEGRDLYKRAMLRIAYAQAAELRKQTAYLNSIESWLISIDSQLEGMQEADDGDA